MNTAAITTIPLGEIVSFEGGGTPSKAKAEFWNGDIPWASVKDITSLELSRTADSITAEGLRNSASRIVPKGNVIIPTRMALGRAAINTMDVAINQDLRVAYPNANLDRRYLLWFIIANARLIDSLGSGATVKGITLEKLRELPIPIPYKNGKPDLDEQKRIAAILDKADAIRRKRQQALRLTDDFLRSVFLDMFGDPVTNPKGWDEKELCCLGKVTTGSTPPSKKDGMFGGPVPFVTPGDLREGLVYSRRFVSEEGALHSRLARAGATLVCCIGATIGKMGKASTRSAFNQQINAVEWNEQIADDYGLTALQFFKNIISERGSSTTLPILNKSSFQSLSIPVPPRSLQEQFCAIACSLDLMSHKQKESTASETALFASLQQRAFRGEL